MAENAWLGLGSNLGDSRATLAEAARRLGEIPGVALRRKSSLYRTPPWGVTDQPAFLNAAVAVETTLVPDALLEQVLGIEEALGRVRHRRWGERTLDIDILHMEGERLRSARLTLPHPRWRERAFVLVPLAEIAPALAIDGIAVAEAARSAPHDGIVCVDTAW